MKRMLCLTVALLAAAAAYADEGMWMINAIGKALESNMQERGLMLGARDI